MEMDSKNINEVTKSDASLETFSMPDVLAENINGQPVNKVAKAAGLAALKKSLEVEGMSDYDLFRVDI